jgi:hypothetical protein
MPGERTPIEGPGEFDIISAIWLLACTDRDTIITYRGIAHRLSVRGLDADGVRKKVKSRAELFSPVVASTWFGQWQTWVVNNGHFPGWVLELPGGSTVWKQTIRDLRRDDVFRCQLRTDTRPPNTPDPCTQVVPSDLIKLGLEHIDRLRKAEAEKREEWLKRITGYRLPALALLVTAFAGLGSGFITWQSLENSRQSARQTAALAGADAQIRLWDLGSRVRGDAYESSLDAMQLAVDAARHGNKAAMEKQFIRIRSNLFKLEPLIENKDSRQQLWDEYTKFTALCLDVSRQAPDALKNVDDTRSGIHERLHHLLFETQGELDPQNLLRSAFN